MNPMTPLPCLRCGIMCEIPKPSAGLCGSYLIYGGECEDCVGLRDTDLNEYLHGCMWYTSTITGDMDMPEDDRQYWTEFREEHGI